MLRIILIIKTKKTICSYSTGLIKSNRQNNIQEYYLEFQKERNMDLILVLLIFLLALTPGLLCDYISERARTKRKLANQECAR